MVAALHVILCRTSIQSTRGVKQPLPNWLQGAKLYSIIVFLMDKRLSGRAPKEGCLFSRGTCAVRKVFAREVFQWQRQHQVIWVHIGC
jgi:hypothetical protein